LATVAGAKTDILFCFNFVINFSVLQGITGEYNRDTQDLQ